MGTATASLRRELAFGLSMKYTEKRDTQPSTPVPGAWVSEGVLFRCAITDEQERETMAEQESKQETFSTVIGPDASFRGDLSVEKDLRLLGKLEGRIGAKGTLMVAKGATLKADVEAAAILVDGDVEGNLTASERIELHDSARLHGDVRTKGLVVAQGATWVGTVRAGKDELKASAAKPKGAAP